MHSKGYFGLFPIQLDLLGRSEEICNEMAVDNGRMDGTFLSIVQISECPPMYPAKGGDKMRIYYMNEA